MRLSEECVGAFHMARWHELPALELYMDQLIIVLQETIGIFTDEKDQAVTRSMINNYVKQKLISPPEKKKYARRHLAALIVVNLLKRVFSMSEITDMIKTMMDAYGMEDAYNLFCERLEQGMQNAFLKEGGALVHVEPGSEAQIAMDAAIAAFISKLLVEEYLERKHSPAVTKANKKK